LNITCNWLLRAKNDLIFAIIIYTQKQHVSNENIMTNYLLFIPVISKYLSFKVTPKDINDRKIINTSITLKVFVNQ